MIKKTREERILKIFSRRMEKNLIKIMTKSDRVFYNEANDPMQKLCQELVNNLIIEKMQLKEKNEKEISLIKKAITFGAKAHEGQFRKYTGEPYFVHCVEVAQILQQESKCFKPTTAQICAACLHDTIEDTSITYADLLTDFGNDVADLVLQLTDISKPSDGNRAKRKEIDRLHFEGSTAEAQSIKLADLISNTRSIVQHDKDFAKIYLKEKQLLLPFLARGDFGLFSIASKILAESLKELNLTNK